MKPERPMPDNEPSTRLNLRIPAKTLRKLKRLKAKMKPFPPTATAIVLRGIDLAVAEYEEQLAPSRRKKAA
jgi:hypothetical protein